jgi:hypothetical protein
MAYIILKYISKYKMNKTRKRMLRNNRTSKTRRKTRVRRGGAASANAASSAKETESEKRMREQRERIAILNARKKSDPAYAKYLANEATQFKIKENKSVANKLAAKESVANKSVVPWYEHRSQVWSDRTPVP